VAFVIASIYAVAVFFCVGQRHGSCELGPRTRQSHKRPSDLHYIATGLGSAGCRVWDSDLVMALDYTG
jgi:hypothetical protein